MSKFKYLFAFLSIACIYSYNAEAKVCFLPNADGSENCTDGVYEASDTCPACVYCKWPKSSASPCDCGDVGYTKYKENDCCDDNGVVCSAPKVCLLNGLQVAGCRTGKSFSLSDNEIDTKLPSIFDKGTSTNVNRGNLRDEISPTLNDRFLAQNYVTICPSNATCSCPNTYKTCPSGQVGVGIACDGKYLSCKCPSEYKKCGTNSTPSGTSCTDSEGTKWTQCLCKSNERYTWKETNDCCGGATTCTDHTGKTYYSCNDVTPPNCLCGYTYNGSCINGCTDNSYKYKDFIQQTGYEYPDAIKAIKDGRYCANTIECAKGYWDATECMPSNYVSSSQACLGMGYITTTCSGKYVGCPFNASMKKCLP